jgi:glycosyltransferase involved in cell wall biosynthesis
VIHVPAGPPAPEPKENLLGHMPAFRDWMVREWATSGRRYDVVHANFFMSGLVAADIKRRLGVPFAVTFHALGRIRKQFQGAADTFPEARIPIEERVVAEADQVIAECPQDLADLVNLYGADPERISIVPCGFDPAEFPDIERAAARRELGIDGDEPVLLQLGRMVPRKGVDTVVRAMGRLRHGHGLPVRLLIVGGSDRTPDPDRDP